MSVANKYPTNEEYENMDEEEKTQFIDNYYNGYYKDEGFKPTFKQKMKYKYSTLVTGVVGLLILALIYGVINLVLIGGQNLFHSGDKAKLEKLEAEIGTELRQIEVIEKGLSSILEHMNDIERQMDGVLSESEYNELVDGYNFDLDLYNTRFKQYSNMINAYNVKIEEANKLSEKVGSTWYVVPIPIGHK